MFYLTYIKLINKDLRVMICMIRDQWPVQSIAR